MMKVLQKLSIQLLLLALLANNGTWQDLNNSSLATRIAALENLEWATYYSGRSNPSNSQGQNGDIYLQY